VVKPNPWLQLRSPPQKIQREKIQLQKSLPLKNPQHKSLPQKAKLQPMATQQEATRKPLVRPVLWPSMA
jgi:hypothetical protein